MIPIPNTKPGQADKLKWNFSIELQFCSVLFISVTFRCLSLHALSINTRSKSAAATPLHRYTFQPQSTTFLPSSPKWQRLNSQTPQGGHTRAQPTTYPRSTLPSSLVADYQHVSAALSAFASTSSLDSTLDVTSPCFRRLARLV